MIRKLIIAACMLLSLAMPSKSVAQKGAAVFGVQTGYTSTNESAIAGLFFHYSFSNAVRIAPEIGCVFRHHNLDAFTADLNVHFPLHLNANVVELYPLVGLDFSSWTRHHLDMNTSDDVSSRSTKMGVNVGAGFQYNATETLMVKCEAKYTIISHFNTFVASIGIGYRF